MCVKEFFGYICGHCSIPTIVRCPLSAQNAAYPTCSIPAERSKFTTEYCHPCSRVAWNQDVLNNENEHKFLHETGLCNCELDFTDKEREDKRLQRQVLGDCHQRQNMKGKSKVSENTTMTGMGAKAPRHRKREDVASRKLHNEYQSGMRPGNPDYLNSHHQVMQQPIFFPVPPRSWDVPRVRLPPPPGNCDLFHCQHDEAQLSQISFHAQAGMVDEEQHQTSGAWEGLGTPTLIESLEVSLADISPFQIPADANASFIPIQEHLADMWEMLNAPVQISTMDYTTRQRSSTI